LSPKRVIVIGGCHVIGFPVGERYSFVSGLLGQSSFSKKHLVTLPYVSVSRLSDTLESVGALRPQDLIILQLGNFETLAPMMFGKHDNLLAADQIGTPGPPSILSNEVFSTQVKSLLRLLGNGILFLVRLIIRQPAFSSQEFSRQLADPKISEALANAGEVVIIGALPTRVWFRNVYRKQANSVLRDFAARRNYAFVDYLHEVRSLRLKAITVDQIHLNVLGHILLAKAIVKIRKYEKTKTRIGYDKKSTI
jgi:hypothetical protein